MPRVIMTAFCLWGLYSAVLSAGDRKPAAEPKNKIPDAAKEILEKADTFEVLSITPETYHDDAGKGRTEKFAAHDDFPGYTVLKRVKVEKAEDRKRIVEAFEKSVAAHSGVGNRCLPVPRHGIRVSAGKRTAEFAICYECGDVTVNVDGKPGKRFYTEGTSAPALNKVIADGAGVGSKAK